MSFIISGVSNIDADSFGYPHQGNAWDHNVSGTINHYIAWTAGNQTWYRFGTGAGEVASFDPTDFTGIGGEPGLAIFPSGGTNNASTGRNVSLFSVPSSGLLGVVQSTPSGIFVRVGNQDAGDGSYTFNAHHEIGASGFLAAGTSGFGDVSICYSSGWFVNWMYKENDTNDWRIRTRFTDIRQPTGAGDWQDKGDAASGVAEASRVSNISTASSGDILINWWTKGRVETVRYGASGLYSSIVLTDAYVAADIGRPLLEPNEGNIILVSNDRVGSAKENIFTTLKSVDATFSGDWSLSASGVVFVGTPRTAVDNQTSLDETDATIQYVYLDGRHAQNRQIYHHIKGTDGTWLERVHISGQIAEPYSGLVAVRTPPVMDTVSSGNLAVFWIDASGIDPISGGVYSDSHAMYMDVVSGFINSHAEVNITLGSRYNRDRKRYVPFSPASTGPVIMQNHESVLPGTQFYSGWYDFDIIYRGGVGNKFRVFTENVSSVTSSGSFIVTRMGSDVYKVGRQGRIRVRAYWLSCSGLVDFSDINGGFVTAWAQDISDSAVITPKMQVPYIVRAPAIGSLVWQDNYTDPNEVQDTYSTGTEYQDLF